MISLQNNKSRKLLNRASLRLKFGVLFICVVVLLLVLNISWNAYFQQKQVEREMLENAQVLAHEMDAVWDFMERNQNQFKVDEDGNRALYCVVAAKSISRSFTMQTDYLIHYTNTETRKGADRPDQYEIDAIEALKANPELQAFYSMEKDDYGRPVFRYIEPLYITESCLDCHGQPKGEPDRLGYPKEGQEVGDIAGVASIIMPADIYMDNLRANLLQDGLVFLLIILCGLGVIFFSLSRLVTQPLARLEKAARQIEDRNFDVDLSGIGDRDEAEDLAQHFAAMAHQLQGLYGHLEDQVDARTAQLKAVNEELDAQRKQLEKLSEDLRCESQYKSDFLAIMSHELRTPLTSILAFTDLWVPKDEEDAIALSEIKENGKLLLQMVNNILEMARIEAGKTALVREAVDMSDLVDSAMGTVGFLAAKKGIEVSANVDADVPLVDADFVKMRRVVENLVGNAIKFSHVGGRVAVDVTCDAEKDLVVLSVTDNGIGIKQEDLPGIFDRFSQASDASERRYGGSGLGLAVVKELVELHGGSVSAKSRFGVGSTFEVRIPTGDGDWGCDG